MSKFTVTAERGAGGRVWVFQCVEHPGAISQGRKLAEADDLMREAIAFVAEVDPGEVEIELDVQLPAEVKVEILETRQRVEQLEEIQQEVAAASRALAYSLVHDQGLTGVDTAKILGVSEQRVSQLTSKFVSGEKRIRTIKKPKVDVPKISTRSTQSGLAKKSRPRADR